MMKLRENSTSTASTANQSHSRPSNHPFLIASSFYILEAIKHWMIGLGMTLPANQLCSILPLHLIKYFIESNQYTALAPTQNPFSCHFVFTCIV